MAGGKVVSFTSSWRQNSDFLLYMQTTLLGQARSLSSKICHRFLGTHSLHTHFLVNINKMFYVKLNWSSLIELNFLLLRALKTSILPY